MCTCIFTYAFISTHVSIAMSFFGNPLGNINGNGPIHMARVHKHIYIYIYICIYT